MDENKLFLSLTEYIKIVIEPTLSTAKSGTEL
jgi:hypothetical protein